MPSKSNSPQSLARPRSPVYEFVYIPTERSNLVQLINRNNPKHRLLDEVMRLTFFEFDVLSDDAKERSEAIEDCSSPSVEDLTVSECSNGVVTADEEVLVKESRVGEETDISSVFNMLNSKLDEMTEATREMHLEVVTLGQDMKSVDSLTTRLLREIRRFHADIRSVRYFDDLIFMLRDQLEHITLRSWPFLTANLDEYYNDVDKLNLVV